MKNYKTIIAAVVAGVALTAVSSQAAVAVVGSLTGQNMTETSPGTVNIDGKVNSWVLSGFSGSGLTFVYQVFNGGTDTIDIASFNGFGGGVVTGGFVTSTAATFGVALPGSQAVTGSGWVYNQTTPGGASSFGGALVVGGISQFFYLNTTATGFTSGIGHIQDTFQANGPTLAPVPEPSTVVAGALMLLPFGIGAIRSLRKDRTA